MSPDLSFRQGNLDFTDLLDSAGGFFQHPHCFFHDAGLPIRIAVAMVSACTETSSLPPFSRTVRTSALAPSACITEIFGRRLMRPSSCISRTALPNADEFPQISTWNNNVVRRFPIELLH